MADAVIGGEQAQGVEGEDAAAGSGDGEGEGSLGWRMVWHALIIAD